MLTDSQIKKIKPPVGKTAPDKHSDGNNLYLHVFSSGGKRWIMDYRFEGKRKAYSIGIYPDVSLADARGKRDEARRLLAQGVDPMQVKKLKRHDDLGHDSFKHVALAWFTKKSPTWSESNSKKVMRRLDVDIFPYLGSSKISEIFAPELLKTIQRIETRSVDTAYRALQECGQIFRYGMAIGSNIHDPSVALKGALTKQEKQHYAAIIEPNAVGELMRAINGFNGSFVVKCALQLAPMFFVRIGELRRAKWSEIDLDAGEWRYFITKTKQNHIVTLSRQAITILKDLQQLTGQYEHVFIGGRDPKRPMSDAAINAALRRMGYDTKTEMTGHGFRAMARTILHERLGVDRDVIEHQLAHRVGDTLGTAYNRTKFLDQRRVMMQTWADYLDELRGGKVIPFPKVAG